MTDGEGQGLDGAFRQGTCGGAGRTLYTESGRGEGMKRAGFTTR